VARLYAVGSGWPRAANGAAGDQVQDRLQPIGHVPVDLNLTVFGDYRHLGTLAMHVGSDVDRYRRASFPELV
jgi:hypothetical protein